MFTVARICYDFDTNLLRMSLKQLKLKRSLLCQMNFQKKQLLILEIMKTNHLTHKCAAIDPDSAKLAFSFGQYLNSLPGAKGICLRGLQSSVPTNSRCPGNFETLRKAKRTDFKVPLSICVWRITWRHLYIKT